MNNNEVLLLEEIADRTFKYTHKLLLKEGVLRDLDIKTDYTPQPEEKIFIYPDADIPKFKVKPFCDKYKVSLVRDKSKANQKFIGKSYIEDFDKKYKVHMYYVTKDRFIQWFNSVIYDTDPKQQALLKILDNYTLDKVYMTRPVMEALSAEYSAPNPFGISLTDPKKYMNSDWVSFIDHTVEASITEILNSTNLYTPECLIKYMNATAVMDEQMYENIKSLFNSPDKSNHIIAIESMSNCDYDKSSVWLLLLIYEFKNAVRNCKASKHVNFQALVSYFDLNINYHMSLDSIINTLSTKELLTPGRLGIVMKRIEEYTINHHNSALHDIVKVVPSRNTLDKLRSNPEEVVAIVSDYEEDLDLE